MSEKKKGGLVIHDRPQISVEMEMDGTVTISLARIGDDFQSVQIDTIAMPAECVKDVAQAMLKIIKK